LSSALARNPAGDGHPASSPDGQKIGFVSNRGGNRDIYVVNADRSGLRNLTPRRSTAGVRACLVARAESIGRDPYVVNDGRFYRTLEAEAARLVRPVGSRRWLAPGLSKPSFFVEGSEYQRAPKCRNFVVLSTTGDGSNRPAFKPSQDLLSLLAIA
jgi:hypothetical protein